MNRKKVTLFIDADDTLWKNNIYCNNLIELLIGKIIEYSNGDILKNEILSSIWKNERIVIKEQGYGSSGLVKSLKRVAEEFISNKDNLEEVFKMLDEGRKNVFNHPIIFFDGVLEHLDILHEKYELILVTKGDVEEQSGKIRRANVGHYFKHIEILYEKNEDAYEKLVKKYNLDKNFTWMIGNSPNSDVNPAKKIGLNTILIPYEFTWELDNGEITQIGPDTKVLNKFSDIASCIEECTCFE